ncbi:MAG: nicotinate mononucleotide-dependent phosphoribosyltransferase CobT [Promethearchaeota archaeon]
MKEIIRIGKKEKIEDFISKIEGKKPLFICVIGNTETAKIPSISAAGANPDITDYTPAADMEYLIYEKCKSIEGVPITPDGIPTPALITKASIDLAEISLLVASGGLNIHPQTPFLEFGGQPGKNISNGLALNKVSSVFERAKILGEQISKAVDYLVIGESVAGGTTTALGVLTAMGFDASNKISSSLPKNPIGLKIKTVKLGLKNAGIVAGDLKNEPLKAIKLLGDPMQPVHAGIVIGAAERIPVLLAGGTQMSAVLAIVNSINPLISKNLAIGTTRWIIEDKQADLKGLIDQINPDIPILGANLNFNQMKYDGLKAYEQGVVKEGVGAGGSVIASILSTKGMISIDQIHQKIKDNYRRIVLNE